MDPHGFVEIQKSRLLGDQDEDSRRLLENRNTEVKGPLCESGSETRGKKLRTQISKEHMFLEEDDPSSNSGIAAFAKKAKVIYPINQKFRPLADGASNPSLNENHKQTPLPNQVVQASTSSLESLSQVDKEDCSSSTTMRSIASDEKFYERTFVKVTCFPEVLTCDNFDVKFCLYNLCLNGLLRLDRELIQEKHVMFVQILRIQLADLLLKKKIDGESYHHILSAQEADLEELEKQFHSRMPSTEVSGVYSSEYQTLEDIERKNKEFYEHTMHNLEAFWKQLDKAHQLLVDQSRCTSSEVMNLMMNLTEQMIQAERLLHESQDMQALGFQEKIISWEHMTKVTDSLKSQIQQESEYRLNAVSETLQQLTTKKKITTRQKEQRLTELLKAFWEEVALFNSTCFQQTKDLILKLLAQRGRRIETLIQVQKDEQVHFLNEVQQTSSPIDFLRDYHELLEKQREMCCNLEEEEDCKTAGAVADLCKELHTSSSQVFEKLVKELFLQTLPAITNMSVDEYEHLKQEMGISLALELEKAEDQRIKSLKIFQELLLHDKQFWAAEYSLSAVLQNHLCEKYEKVIQGVLIRFSGLSEDSTKYVLHSHRLLMQSVLRTLAQRNFAMATLTQMKMSRKKSVLQELREQYVLEKSTSCCKDAHQWQLQQEMESHILEEERRLEEEMQLARSEFQQQLLTELQEVLQLLQQRMEHWIGQALVQHAQQEAARGMTEQDNREFKERLIDTTEESVYVTSNSINRLVHSYYQELDLSLETYEQEKLKRLKHFQEKAEGLRRKQEMVDHLSDEKVDRCTTTKTLGAGQRMFLQQKRLLDQFCIHEQIRLDSLKEKKSMLHHLEAQLEGQLKEAEQNFISELATLARVHLPESKQPTSKTAQSDQNLKTRRKNSEPWETVGPSDLKWTS
ncbi:evC complex member EVC isoform X2 [Microcaecilia unicolor]|uniref:Ellis-van Creveld syndrome protein isoform X2 n=1 Tax=Microcaecilia unicolor TaxID=1415580 RepID=A0A6P7X0Z6_9AMPH|nr:ellis-van Creveld syndrome protein isoform X2 [Microcaecilia unicolor]